MKDIRSQYKTSRIDMCKQSTAGFPAVARCTNASAFGILPSFASLIRVESLGTRLSDHAKDLQL